MGTASPSAVSLRHLVAAASTHQRQQRSAAPPGGQSLVDPGRLGKGLFPEFKAESGRKCSGAWRSEVTNPKGRKRSKLEKTLKQGCLVFIKLPPKEAFTTAQHGGSCWTPSLRGETRGRPVGKKMTSEGLRDQKLTKFTFRLS